MRPTNKEAAEPKITSSSGGGKTTSASSRRRSVTGVLPINIVHGSTEVKEAMAALPQQTARE